MASLNKFGSVANCFSERVYFVYACVCVCVCMIKCFKYMEYPSVHQQINA